MADRVPVWIPGPWGTQGPWDLVILALGIAGLSFLILFVVMRWRERTAALVALALVPLAYVALSWLGDPTIVGPDSGSMGCLIRGPFDADSACEVATLGSSVVVVVALALSLVALIFVGALRVRSRAVRR